MQRRDFLKAGAAVPTLPWASRTNNFPDEGRRKKAGYIPYRLILPVMAGELRIERPDPDAILRFGAYQEERDAFLLVFTSKNWEPVPEGKVCPTIELEFIDTTTGLPI